MTLGFLGLGKMGSRMAKKLAMSGHSVHVWNRTADVGTALSKEVKGIEAFSSVKDLVSSLPAPRIVWLMLPAGDPTEVVLREAIGYLAPSDIVIDGANAHFRDSDRRAKELADRGVRFLGIGVSGGIIAETRGYPLMVGGDKTAYEYIQLILDCLAKPSGGHEYFGSGGAGHYVKMVHNGIEYGQMQAIAEGFGVLEKSEFHLDLPKVARLWQKGTIVSGFLIERTADVLSENPTLSGVKGVVVQSGEGQWTVEQAKTQGVPIGGIEQSLSFRIASQTDPAVQSSFAAKLLASLRRAFGGHSVEKSS